MPIKDRRISWRRCEFGGIQCASHPFVAVISECDDRALSKLLFLHIHLSLIFPFAHFAIITTTTTKNEHYGFSSLFLQLLKNCNVAHHCAWNASCSRVFPLMQKPVWDREDGWLADWLDVLGWSDSHHHHLACLRRRWLRLWRRTKLHAIMCVCVCV